MHFSFLNSNPVISWRYTGSARHIGDKAHTKQKMKHWWYSQIWSRYSYDSDSHTGDALVICRTIATQIVSYRNQTDSSCYWLMRSNYKWVTWRHQRKYIKSNRFKQVQDFGGSPVSQDENNSKMRRRVRAGGRGTGIVILNCTGRQTVNPKLENLSWNLDPRIAQVVEPACWVEGLS